MAGWGAAGACRGWGIGGRSQQVLSLAFIKVLEAPSPHQPWRLDVVSRAEEEARALNFGLTSWIQMNFRKHYRTTGTKNRSAHGSGPAARGPSRTKARTKAGSGSCAQAQGPLMGVPGGPRPGEAPTVPSFSILRLSWQSSWPHSSPAEAGICRWSWWDAEN